MTQEVQSLSIEINSIVNVYSLAGGFLVINYHDARRKDFKK